jgi:adenylate kinase family enzyme
MDRILIVGCSGSGKSTLSRKLSERASLPVVHLDQLFWQSGWVSVSREVFDQRLFDELENPKWIIDGNFDRTLPLRLARCDTAICLNYSRRTCLTGIVKRVAASYGHTRPDMAEGCPERVDWSFLKWVWNFPKKQLPVLRQALADAEKNGVRVLRFKNRKACREWLESLPAGTVNSNDKCDPVAI